MTFHFANTVSSSEIIWLGCMARNSRGGLLGNVPASKCCKESWLYNEVFSAPNTVYQATEDIAKILPKCSTHLQCPSFAIPSFFVCPCGPAVLSSFVAPAIASRKACPSAIPTL